MASQQALSLPLPKLELLSQAKQHEWEQAVVKSLSYAQQWKARRHTPVIMFDLAWHTTDGDNNSGQQWLVGCTNHGEIVVWKLAKNNVNGEDDDYFYEDDETMMNTSSSDSSSLQPVWRSKISLGVLYSCSFSSNTNTNQDLLVVTGDTGVWVYDWNRQILPLLIRNSSSKQQPQDSDTLKPWVRLQPHPSASTNDVSIHQAVVVNSGNVVVGAASDTFGLYKWDLERGGTIVSTYYSSQISNSKHGSSHRGAGSQYTVALASSSTDGSGDTATNNNLLLAGGEDGMLSIWDIQQDKLVERMDMMHHVALSSSSSLSSPKRKRTATANKNNAGGWISYCLANSENGTTWAIGGGLSRTNATAATTNTNSSDEGFLATIHASTRSVMASTRTHASVQSLDTLSGTSSLLLSAGNDGCTRQWDPWTLDLVHTTVPPETTNGVDSSLRRPTSFALSVNNSGDRVAVAGLGNTVDVLEHNGRLLACQLTL